MHVQCLRRNVYCEEGGSGDVESSESTVGGGAGVEAGEADPPAAAMNREAVVLNPLIFLHSFARFCIKSRSEHLIRAPREHRGTHLCSRTLNLIQKQVQIPKAQLLPEIRIQLPVVPSLVFPRLLGIGVRLVNEEIVGQDVERDAGKVKFKQACCFVSSISDESLVTPVHASNTLS